MNYSSYRNSYPRKHVPLASGRRINWGKRQIRREESPELISQSFSILDFSLLSKASIVTSNFMGMYLHFQFNDKQSSIYKQKGQTPPLCTIHHGHFWKKTRSNSKVWSKRNMITDVFTNLYNHIKYVFRVMCPSSEECFFLGDTELFNSEINHNLYRLYSCPFFDLPISVSKISNLDKIYESQIGQVGHLLFPISCLP